MAEPVLKNEFPDSIIKTINDEISFNAPVRTLSVLIPIDMVKFGRDCIELHNDIVKKILKEPRLKLGDRIVGTTGSTHQILLRKGLASPLKVFSFVTQTDKPATGNASAHKLQESVGEYVKKNYGGLGVSIYGVSALDGYHSMLLTYRIKNGVHEFNLIDQGPATSILTGKSTFNTAQGFDTALSEYVRDKQGKRTRGGHQYQANIQIYKIYPGKTK